MFRRIWFPLVTMFFVVMNVLLLRSQLGSRGAPGSAVRPGIVFERLLQSSDGSDLEIRHRGIKVGYCRWAPSILDVPLNPLEEAMEPEGMVKEIIGYAIDLRGNVSAKDGTRFRFDAQVRFGTNQAWTDLHVGLNVYLRNETQPVRYDVKVDAARETLSISPPLLDEEGKTEQVLRFQELRDPKALLRKLGGPLLPATLAAMGIPLDLPTVGSTNALRLEWEAHKGHRVPLGRLAVPVYRLHAHLLDRYDINVYITESGEVFRIDLPNDIMLINDRLTNL